MRMRCMVRLPFRNYISRNLVKVFERVNRL
jgi:hypothetical protein